jgi:hypothetical protein
MVRGAVTMTDPIGPQDQAAVSEDNDPESLAGEPADFDPDGNRDAEGVTVTALPHDRHGVPDGEATS